MKKNGLSVNEFKMWIAGIEDMQEKGWTPNASQWAKIKAKITQLEDTVVEYQPERTTVQSYQREPIEQPNPWQQPLIQPMHTSLDMIPKQDVAYMNHGYQTDFL